MNIPPGEEVVDPFAECALTLNHIYQIYVISSNTTIKEPLTAMTVDGIFTFNETSIGYDTDETKRFWIITRDEDRPYATDNGDEEYVRIFKDVSEYEPGMIKGGYKKRGRKTRRTLRRKRARSTRRRRRH